MVIDDNVSSIHISSKFINMNVKIKVHPFAPNWKWSKSEGETAVEPKRRKRGGGGKMCYSIRMERKKTCECLFVCVLYRKRDGIIAKNQIENNSKKSNIDIDLNKDMNEYYYYNIRNGVAAGPYSMFCTECRCVHVYVLPNVRYISMYILCTSKIMRCHQF